MGLEFEERHNELHAVRSVARSQPWNCMEKWKNNLPVKDWKTDWYKSKPSTSGILKRLLIDEQTVQQWMNLEKKQSSKKKLTYKEIDL